MSILTFEENKIQILRPLGPKFQNLTFLLGPDMGPLDRGGQIQNKSFYSQPVFLAAVLRVSYSLSLICLMTSEDIKHKIISRPAWRMEPLAGCSQTGLHLSTGSLPVVIPHSSGAVWESRWTSWAVRPNELSGFRGRKDLLHRASALVTTCP